MKNELQIHGDLNCFTVSYSCFSTTKKQWQGKNYTSKTKTNNK